MLRYGILILTLLAIFLSEGARGQVWVQKIGGTGLGNPLTSNPLNRDIIYTAAGSNRVYVSRTQGYTWQTLGNLVPGGGIIKAIAVSPLDTLKMLVGVEMSSGQADHISRSTDGGNSWTDVWSGSFSYFGQPVEFSRFHPDTVYTMGADTIWRSVDFGATWEAIQKVTGFNTWCDASVRPDSANILLLGDNTSGIWKTTDAGASWTQKYATLGEIPSIAIDPFNPQIAYASKYGGGGGVVKTTNGGETWFGLTVPSGNRDTWWVTCSPDYPGFVYYGTYTGDTSVTGIYLSRNSGATWQRFAGGLYPLGVLNYGLIALDSLTVVALQGGGVFKLQFPAALHLQGPNGGEYFQSGTVHPISWTSSYLPLVRLDYSTDGGASWNLIADSLTPGASPYAWLVPAGESASCKVRVSDARFSGVSDASDGVFSISPTLIEIASPEPGAIWTVGSVKTISWISNGVPMARLDCSSDGGATWSSVTVVKGAAGSYVWTVPDMPTASARVRLVDLSDSLVNAESALFTIVKRRSYLAALGVADNGGASDTLYFGADGGATDLIDPAFGEAELSPKPAPGLFDARWRIPGTNGSAVDVRDTLALSHEENLFTGEFQPGPAWYPVTLFWSPESLGEGTYILRDTLTHGQILSVDMRRESTAVITDAGITAFEVAEYRSVTVTVPGNGGWALISLPVITGDRRKNTLFANSTSLAYAYGLGYEQRDTLEGGVGYWLKMQQTSLVGGASGADTVPVKTGWNIIGSVSSPLPVGLVGSAPESLMVSSIFGYENGYFAADSILPGRGYWVKVKAPGSILLGSAAAALSSARAVRAEDSSPKLNTLTNGERTGRAATLLFGPSGSAARGEMPPLPPEGAFDARFTSSREVAEHPAGFENELVFPISVKSASNEIFFSWHVENEENFTYILSENDDSRTVSQLRLTSDGSTNFTLHKHSTFTLKVRHNLAAKDLPTGYSMGELYPNPFNPRTRFTYTVPADARVTIVVYSVLGRVVATLADEMKSPGAYEQEWNGAGADGAPASSGVYYVRMTASSGSGVRYSQIRAVLLMK